MRWCRACENWLEARWACEEGEGALGREGGTSSLARRRARERGQKSRERGQGRVIIIPWRIDLPATKAKESSTLKWRLAILQQLAVAAGCCFWRGAEGELRGWGGECPCWFGVGCLHPSLTHWGCPSDPRAVRLKARIVWKGGGCCCPPKRGAAVE